MTKSAFCIRQDSSGILLLLSDFPCFIQNLRFRVILYELRNLIHQTICHDAVQYNSRHTDDDDPMGVLLVDL